MGEELLKRCGVVIHASDGKTLFLQNSEAECFYYLVDGQVRLYSIKTDGSELDISCINPGEYFGEVILFSGKQYPVHAECIGETSLLSFSKTRVNRLMQNHIEVAHFLLSLTSSKCRFLSKRLQWFQLHTVNERLLLYLKELYVTQGSNAVTLNASKQETARFLGTIPATFSRALSRLNADRLIGINKGKITLTEDFFLRVDILS